MGRNICILTIATLGLLASGCGLTPAEEALVGEDGDCPSVSRPEPAALEQGVILDFFVGRRRPRTVPGRVRRKAAHQRCSLSDVAELWVLYRAGPR